MHQIISEITEKLSKGIITKNQADKILFGLFSDMKSVCEHDYVKRGGPAVYFLRCSKCGKVVL